MPPVRNGEKTVITGSQLDALNSGHVLQVLCELDGLEPSLSYTVLNSLTPLDGQERLTITRSCTGWPPSVAGKRLGEKYIVCSRILGQGSLSTVKLGLRSEHENPDTNSPENLITKVAVKVYHLPSLIRRREFCGSKSLTDGLSGLDKVVNELWILQQRVKDVERCIHLIDAIVVINPQKENVLTAQRIDNVDCVSLDASVPRSLTRQQALTAFARQFPHSKLYLVLDHCELGPVMVPTSMPVSRVFNHPGNDFDNNNNNNLETDSGLSEATTDATKLTKCRSRSFWAPAYQSLLYLTNNELSRTVNFADAAECSSRFGNSISELGYSEPLVKCFIRDAAEALAFLYSPQCRVAHRDIKPCNLLLTEEGRLKLGDFNTACLLEGLSGRVRRTEGTYCFLPPECVDDGDVSTAREFTATPLKYNGHDAEAADVWALGVSLWVLILGTLPFYSAHLSKLFQEISQCHLDFSKFERPGVDPSVGPPISINCIDLLTQMLQKDPEKRLTFNQVLESPWFVDVDYSVSKKFAETALQLRKRLHSVEYKEA